LEGADQDEPASIDRDGAAVDGGHSIDRRTFIVGAGAVTGSAALTFNHLAAAAALRGRARIPTHPTTISLRSLLGSEILTVEGPQAPTTTLFLRRREDLLFMQIDGYNLVRKGQTLARADPGQAATLVLTFAPQHLTEQAFFENATDSGPGNETPSRPGASAALLAGPSRLAFTFPGGVDSIPFTVAGLLDWAKLDLSVAPAASYSPPPFLLVLEGHGKGHRRRSHARRPTGSLQLTLAAPKPSPVIQLAAPGLPAIRAPEPTETSIELPWHLALSPIAGSHWSHSVEPLTTNGSTELWRTRLAAGSALNAGEGGSLRAVWNFDTRTSDYASPGTPTLEGAEPPDADLGPFRTSLTPNDRYQIVKLTSDFSLSGRADIAAARLWLTARGGVLDSNGVWDDPTLSLINWKHLATLGRDQYVKVVKKGFLFPFGHHVVETVVTEREFELIDGEIVATSRQITYLAVRAPTMSYDPADTFGIADNSRDLPFRSLTLKTLRTPDLDAPINFTDPSLGSQNSIFMSGTPFVPTVSGKPFMWHFVGTDWVGREIAFSAQAVFVIYEDAVNPLPAAIVRGAYNALDSDDPVRVAQLGGKTIAFAQSITTGDTDLQVKSISFGASLGAGGSVTQFEDSDTARCFPTLSPSINGADTGARAIVRLASAEQASGGAPLAGNSSPAVAYYPPYVTTGFSTSEQPTGNAGNVFMEILYDASNATNLTFGNGSSGGVLTPNIQLQGISRSLGPVADLENIFNGSFNPSSIFTGLSDDLQAKILGGVLLADLIAPVASFLDGGTPEIPSPKALRITYTTDGTVVTTTVIWKPDIVTDNPIVTPSGDGTTSFTLDATVTTDLANPQSSSYTISGTLENFVVNLMSTSTDQFIQIGFDSLTFTSATGQKADVSVKIKSVQFVGPLKFVQQLEQFMNFSGEGGPKITISPTGVGADLYVALPTIAVGLFTLSHVGIDANFFLPYDGSPAVFGFGFCTRDNPFQLSIAIFGGGGYFAMKIGTDGVHEIDAGFDFGAMAAINLGVASGSVSLTAGIQFSYMLDPSTGKDTCTLTGYVKLTGSLSILGIITMSLLFDLSLTYEEPPSSVTGTATVQISITLVFFSISVSATATKTFTNPGTASSQAIGSGERANAQPQLATSPPTFASQMKLADWESYVSAFAPVPS
jgi:hypothetical protein